MGIRRWTGPACLSALLLAASGLPRASAQLLGPEFQVNSYTTSYQSFPAVGGDGLGNFVVVWMSNDQDGSETGLFGQRFNSLGAPVGSEFQVNSYTTGNQQRSAVAADGSGNFVVVWDSAGQDGSGDGVFGQRYDSAGSPVGNEFQVNSYTTSWQSSPALATDSVGNFVVVWDSSDQDGSSLGVFGQRYDSAGGPLGNEFQVNSYTTGNQQRSAVAADGSGNFVVVWNSGYQDGSWDGVFGQRFDALGNPVGSEFQVNSYTTNGQGNSTVAADFLGNFVVVWNSPQDGSSYGVFGQRFDSAGGRVGSEFQINTYTTDAQVGPVVAADVSGNFVVAWESSGQDGSNRGVFGQRFHSAGSKVGSEFQVSSYTTSYQYFSAIAADNLGGFVVAWTSDNQDGSNTGVFGQQLAQSVFSDGFEAAEVCAWSLAVGSGDVC